MTIQAITFPDLLNPFYIKMTYLLQYIGFQIHKLIILSAQKKLKKIILELLNLVRVVIQHFLKTIVVQFVFEAIE